MKRILLTVLGMAAFGVMATGTSEDPGRGDGGAGTGEPCGTTVDCTPGNVCWNAVCVGAGTLRFSASWTVASDYDLHVKTPSGTELSFRNRQGAGGALDVDDCVSDQCHTTGTHVENIFWQDVPAPGTYEYWVENYSGTVAGAYSLEVVTSGHVIPNTGSLTATARSEGTHLFITIPYGGGGSSSGGVASSGPHGDAGAGAVCNTSNDCQLGSVCWNSTCVGSGSLRFSLSWTVTSDFDLHVLTPAGTELSYANRSAEGGSLDVDDCNSAGCRSPTSTHVENVFWPAQPATGVYTYWVQNYSGAAEGAFTLEVSASNRAPVVTTGTLPATSRAESTHYTFSF